MPLRAREMNYYHWASQPVKLRKRHYPQSGHPKPNGLWFDVNEDWRRWCESTDFRREDLRYRHTLTILDSAHMLFLRNARDIDSFTRKYRRNSFGNIQLLQSPQQNEDFARQYGRDLFSEIQLQFSNNIEWGAVAETYSGIIVAPYSRARRDTYLWYYGWHCASGCVWDTSAIRLGAPSQMAE